MKEYIITEKDAPRRLDKYVMHILKAAPASFAYKMLRKKNIVLNDAKACGNELLKAGDRIRFYLSDETFEKFCGPDNAGYDAGCEMPPVIYEDEDVIIVDKPSGMLTQRSSSDDISLNDICLSYLRRKGDPAINDDTFTPSVCNRLDRNTSGLVTFAKTYRAARILSEAFADKKLGKFYKCITVGVLKEDLDLTGSLTKNSRTNTVKVSEEDKGSSYIHTRVHPLSDNGELTIAEVRLYTGKTHQIRAHLASAGYPILGDDKYGNRQINRKYRRQYGITSQMLVCCQLVFPDDFELASLAGAVIETDTGEEFKKVSKWQHGIQEA